MFNADSLAFTFDFLNLPEDLHFFGGGGAPNTKLIESANSLQAYHVILRHRKV